MGPYLLPKFPTLQFKVPRRMSNETIESKFKTTGCINKDMEPIWVLDHKKLCHQPDHIGMTDWEPSGYFGNCGSHIDFYVKSFLRVEFAPYEERKKKIEAWRLPEDPKKEAVGQNGKGKGKSSSAPKKAKVMANHLARIDE